MPTVKVLDACAVDREMKIEKINRLSFQRFTKKLFEELLFFFFNFFLTSRHLVDKDCLTLSLDLKIRVLDLIG